MSRALDGKHVVMMVEPRTNENFKTILESVERTIDPSWTFYFFGTNRNEKEINQFFKNSKRKLVFQHIPKKYMKTPTYVNYNRMFTEPDLWDMIDAENILVVQTDVGMCDHKTEKLDSFTHYPYIGCAYSDEEGENNWWKDTYKDAHFYGVGGMSFRKKSFIMECLKTNPNTKGIPEDVYFSTCLGKLQGAPKPNSKDMHKFCAQSDYSGDIKSLGVHKPTLIHNNKQKKILLADCPIAHQLGVRVKEKFTDSINVSNCVTTLSSTLLIGLTIYLIIILSTKL